MSALVSLPQSDQPFCPCCGAEVSPLDLLIDETLGVVVYNNVTARLTRAEMRFFKALFNAYPRIVPKPDLYRATCPALDRDGGPEPKIIDVTLCKVRKKVEPLGLSFETEWGVGYKLVLAPAAASALDRRRRFGSSRPRNAPDQADIRMIALFRAQGWPLTDVARRLNLRFREVAAVFDRLDAEERERRERRFMQGAVR